MRHLPIAIIMALLLVNCGGGGSSGGEQQLLLKTVTPQTVTGLEDTTLTYQVELYALENGAKGELVFGPADLASYNVDESLYAVRVSDVDEGDYIALLKVVKKASGATSNETPPLPGLSISAPIRNAEGESDMVLSSFEQALTLSDETPAVDLSAADWASNGHDLDNDGLSNLVELKLGTNPSLSDSDGDGVADLVDAFPTNGSESVDLDGDGIGDSGDEDADNDGISDEIETNNGTNPLNADTDGDGVKDGQDNCALVINGDQENIDGDNLGNLCDDDMDGDTISNAQETAKGLNPKAQDSDGDGLADAADVFPLDIAETLDTDGDGIGDNGDNDDDNDGLSDVLEAAATSNSKIADTDGDGVKDGADNCVLLANTSQANNEGDAIGDDCDLDDDNDGLTDTEEAIIGVDGFITNAKVADIDADGKNDSADNCPSSGNVNQTDTDNDNFGDACDCEAADPAINQLASDTPDPQVTDSNCDGMDGNKYKAVFVSTSGTTAADKTNPDNPTSDLQAALNYAASQGFQVYVANGGYIVDTLKLVDGVSLFGGFSEVNDYTQRDVTGLVLPTKLYTTATSKANAALTIDSFTKDVTIGGFVIENKATDVPQATNTQAGIIINKSSVTLQNNIFRGNSAVQNETLLELRESDLVADGNQFYGESMSASTGMNVINSEGFIKNNLFVMGDAFGTIGIKLSGSNMIIVNNTIDGGQHGNGVSYGVSYEHSAPSFINNIFITRNNSNQASIHCSSGTTTTPVPLENNIFLRYTTNSIILFPSFITCGSDYLISNAGLQGSAELAASNNIVSTTTNLTELATILDTSDSYALVTGSSAIDAGKDVSSTQSGEVLYDIFGVDRDPSTQDIGAMEF